MVQVVHVPAFEDNYIWLIRGPDSGSGPGAVAAVDPGDAEPVLEYLEQSGDRLVAILCTHHHGDHVGGVGELVAHNKVPVYGPADEHIPHRDHPLRDGDHISIPPLKLSFDVLGIPGHTLGHIAYTGHGVLFCGDTLFSAGCGRLFEGTAEQMANSLAKLGELPATTKVYCGHEYTEANLRFARRVEPDNNEILKYAELAEQLRTQGKPTLPSTLELEHSVNPFLRTQVESVRVAVEQHTGAGPLVGCVDVFRELRRWKDVFRG
jgi:hydroxyacylglutathione hydrolase